MPMRQIIYPFAADSAERDSLPYSRPLPGQVAYNTGYTVDYQLQLSIDPNAKAIERKLMNGLFYDITNNIQVWQQQCIPDWFQPNGTGPGQWAPYQRNAMVRRNGVNYISLVDENSDPPGNGNPYWEKVELSSYVLGQIPMRFGGGNGPTGDFNSRTSSETIAFSGSVTGWANRPSDFGGLFECFRIPSSGQIIQRYTDVSGAIYWRGLSGSGWSVWSKATSTAETNPYLKWFTRNDLAWDWEFDRGWVNQSGSNKVKWELTASSIGLNSHVTARAVDVGTVAGTVRGVWETEAMGGVQYVNNNPIHFPFSVDTESLWDGLMFFTMVGMDSNGAEVTSTDFEWTTNESSWNNGPAVGAGGDRYIRGIARSVPLVGNNITQQKLRITFMKPDGSAIKGALNMRIGANDEWAYRSAARALTEKVSRSGDTMTGALVNSYAEPFIATNVPNSGYAAWLTSSGALTVKGAVNENKMAVRWVSPEGSSWAAISAYRSSAGPEITMGVGDIADTPSHLFKAGKIQVIHPNGTSTLWYDGNVTGSAYITGSSRGDLNDIRTNWLPKSGGIMTGTLVNSAASPFKAPNVSDSGYQAWATANAALAITCNPDNNKMALKWEDASGGIAAISAFSAGGGAAPQITLHLKNAPNEPAHIFTHGKLQINHTNGVSTLWYDGNVTGSAYITGSSRGDLNDIRTNWLPKSGGTMSGKITAGFNPASAGSQFESTGLSGSGWDTWRAASKALSVHCAQPELSYQAVSWNNGTKAVASLGAYWSGADQYVYVHMDSMPGNLPVMQINKGSIQINKADGNRGATYYSDGNIGGDVWGGDLFSNLNDIRTNWLPKAGGNMTGTITSTATVSAFSAESIASSSHLDWKNAPSAFSIKTEASANKIGLAWGDGLKCAAISAWDNGSGSQISFHLAGSNGVSHSGVSHSLQPGVLTVNSADGLSGSTHKADGNISGSIWSDSRQAAIGKPNEINEIVFRDRGGLFAAARGAGLPTGEIIWTMSHLAKLPSGLYNMTYDPVMGGEEKNSSIWLGMNAFGVQVGTYAYGLLEIKHGTSFTVLMYYPHSVGGTSGTSASVLFNCVYWGDMAATINAAGVWRRMYNSSNMQFTY